MKKPVVHKTTVKATAEETACGIPFLCQDMWVAWSWKKTTCKNCLKRRVVGKEKVYEPTN